MGTNLAERSARGQPAYRTLRSGCARACSGQVLAAAVPPGAAAQPAFAGADARFAAAARCGARGRVACAVADLSPAAAARYVGTLGTVKSLKRLFARGWLHKSQQLRIVTVNGV